MLITRNARATGISQPAFRPLAVLLFLAFWFALPYDLHYTVENHGQDAAAIEAAQGNLSRQIALPLITLVSILVLRTTRSERRSRPLNMTSLAAFSYLALALLSVSWSDDPGLTAKRLFVLACLGVVTYMLASRLNHRQFIDLALLCCGAPALIGFCAELAFGSFQPTDPGYRFSGATHPNTMGMNIAVFIVSCVSLMCNREKSQDRLRQWFYIGGSIAGGILLVLTKSRTATAACALVVAWLILQANCKRFYLTFALLGLGIVAIGTLTLFDSGIQKKVQSAVFLGRQDEETSGDLSSRAPLWAECLEYIADRPVAGFGYGSFWTPERVSQISDHQGWSVPYAHNTFLDVALELGLPGALLFSLVILGSLATLWAHLRLQPTPELLYSFGLALWLSLTMVLESVPIAPFLPPTLLTYALIVRGSLFESSSADVKLHDSPDPGPKSSIQLREQCKNV